MVSKFHDAKRAQASPAPSAAYLGPARPRHDLSVCSRLAPQIVMLLSNGMIIPAKGVTRGDQGSPA